MEHFVRITFSGLIALKLLLYCSVALADKALQISIISSSKNSYYDQTINTLTDQVDQTLRIKILSLESSLSDPSTVQNSDLIITLGASATQTVSSRFPEKRLISAYITEQHLNNLTIPNKQHLPVLLDQPLSRYIAFSHLLLDARTIGVVSRNQINFNKRQRQLLRNNSIEFKQFQLKEMDQLLPGIRSIGKTSETLLMMPDQTIYNRDTLKGVLLTTYRSRTPVVSYSPAHVKSGALASIYSSPIDIGKHLGELLDQFLLRNSLPADKPQFARYYSIRYNQQVAHALGITLPNSTELRTRLEKVLK